MELIRTDQFAFGATSNKRLNLVYPILERIARIAIQCTPTDFGIAQGRRTLEQQKKYLLSGKSKVRYSRHLEGKAIDIFVWDATNKRALWGVNDIEPVARVFQEIGRQRGVDIEWGGDWKTFIDPPHLQLSIKQYPQDLNMMDKVLNFDWS